jgi:hypothetical protein
MEERESETPVEISAEMHELHKNRTVKTEMCKREVNS